MVDYAKCSIVTIFIVKKKFNSKDYCVFVRFVYNSNI